MESVAGQCVELTAYTLPEWEEILARSYPHPKHHYTFASCTTPPLRAALPLFRDRYQLLKAGGLTWARRRHQTFMDVLLDTNIIRADVGARSGRFDVLQDYLKRTQSRLLLPHLVFDELRAVYTRELTDRLGKLAAAAATAVAFMPHRDIPDLVPVKDIAAEVELYAAYLMGRLGLSLDRLLPHSPEYLDDILDRAVWRRRPCSDRGEELRDALIWLVVLDAASKAKDRQVAFVSANIRQFGDGDGKLHPDLAAEAEKREVTVHYFRSLDDFAREHANRVTFVTHEWIMSRIPPEEVLDAAEWSMLSRGESILEDALESGESAAGEARMLNTSVGDIDWYVNELEEGTLRLEVIFSVEAEIEGPIWRSIWRQRPPRWYANAAFGDVWPEPVDLQIETERTAVTRSLTFEVVVEGEIRAQELVEWEVTEVNDA